MMKEFSVQCNTLSYNLKRIVPDGDRHQLLQAKRNEKIEVIPNTYMYFKIITKDQLAPGKINFAYGSD